MRTFEKAFTLPFSLDEVDNTRVYDANEHFIFSFIKFSRPQDGFNTMIDQTIDIINGKECSKKDVAQYYPDTQIINISGIPFINIRGWGYLNGYLKLTEEEAAAIQDDLADYICQRLNGKK